MAEEISIQKSLVERTRDYFGEVRIEMKRVSWPSKQEIYGTTLMVILTTFGFGLYFYICDLVFSGSMRRILSYLRPH